MATKTYSWKRQRGRPGKAKLPCKQVTSRATAQRNRKIVKAVTRERNPLTQQQAAARYGVDQSTVSEIVRNPCSGQVKETV